MPVSCRTILATNELICETTTMTDIIQLPQFQRPAAVRGASFDKGARTVDVIWTTGATVRRLSWADGEFDEELVVSNSTVRLARLNSGAPFLDTHTSSNLAAVIGSVVPGSARLESGQGLAKIKLSGRSEAAGVVKDISDGVIRNISVGYRVLMVEKTDRRGDVPLHRVIDWEPWEISAVPIPADAGAHIRAHRGEALFTCKILEGRDLVQAIRNRMLRAQLEMEQRLAGIR
ncbi:hypothetical protein X741_21680 [Mesorhizobium sp. LNHC229A00]|nr:hypothetical protein X741_21680 [Mesorhizobium sp. LNHC229A00]